MNKSGTHTVSRSRTEPLWRHAVVNAKLREGSSVRWREVLDIVVGKTRLKIQLGPALDDGSERAQRNRGTR